MKSVMSHNFSKIPTANIPRSVFNRSHGLKTTFQAGSLIPILTDEVLPGDTFNLKTTLFARLATPIFPIMDNMYLETFYFFVPNRILWDNWEKFNGAQDNPGDSTDFTIPSISSAAGFTEGQLGDYFGLPTQVAINHCSALHFRAYNLIFRDWFRDENLQASPAVPLGDGPDLDTLFPILKRGKRHDYFTSCLPFPQKGEASVIPLTGFAPVHGDGKSLGFTDKNGAFTEFGLYERSGNIINADSGMFNVTLPHTQVPAGNEPTINYALGITENSDKSGLHADLSEASAVTINQLRDAFMIQKVLETDARGGTRYIEMIKAHFGVTNPDFRLQRPEYLGGSSTRVNINPVQQTSSTDGVSPQGNLAGFGTAADSSHGFNKSFTEHGVILGLVNVRADLTYQQGMPRMWSRETRYEFYLPNLAHLGEQAVQNGEIYYGATDSINKDTFGYQEHWAEYRYKQSQITGKFRSNATGTLDPWHLSQNFTSLPALNAVFIEDDTADILDRVVAVTTEPDFLLDVYFDMKCARPMPVYSVPGLSSHF